MCVCVCGSFIFIPKRYSLINTKESTAACRGRVQDTILKELRVIFVFVCRRHRLSVCVCVCVWLFMFLVHMPYVFV